MILNLEGIRRLVDLRMLQATGFALVFVGVLIIIVVAIAR